MNISYTHRVNVHVSSDHSAIDCSSPLPSHSIIEEIVQICRRTFFKGFYGSAPDDMTRLYSLLFHQLSLVIPGEQHEDYIRQLIRNFFGMFDDMQRSLVSDVEATYRGDPAVTDYAEVVLCYPGIYAVTNYRVAHALHSLGVPLIPRMISEQAHSLTGIDIHPAATIGREFMIDHGTGVVIGATSTIGKGVKIYQGVTLGARSFERDENGDPVKGVPRHPTVEDDVVIYANATVLGHITIGKGAVIGGNVWVTEDVAPGERVVQATPHT